MLYLLLVEGLFFYFMDMQVVDHQMFMGEAFKEALKAFDKGEIPVGAVVVIGGKVVARAHNQTETLNDPTAHAEMLAITSATNTFGGKYIDKATLYVTLEPCPMCAAALNWAQVKCIVFGASDSKRGFSLYTPSLLHPRCEVIAGVMEGESSELVRQFFKSIRGK